MNSMLSYSSCHSMNSCHIEVKCLQSPTLAQADVERDLLGTTLAPFGQLFSATDFESLAKTLLLQATDSSIVPSSRPARLQSSLSWLIRPTFPTSHSVLQPAKTARSRQDLALLMA